MTTLQLIGTATGLGFLAGLRLYSTVLAVGVFIRLGWINLSEEFQSLELLANDWVLGLAGVGFLVEFFADKIPWVDSAWDALHTFIRPLGASALALTALGDMGPEAQLLVALLSGGVALSSHSMKAATRLAVNQSPEPVSNSLVSLAGDVAVPMGVWFALEHPLVAGSIAAVALITFLLLAPKIVRLLRVQLSALVAALRGLFGARAEAAEEVPSEYRRFLTGELGLPTPGRATRVVARNGVTSLRNSVGYLLILPNELVFVTRRWWRYRAFRLPLQTDAELEHNRGLLLDGIVCRTGGRSCEFGVFKDGPELETLTLRTAASPSV